MTRPLTDKEQTVIQIFEDRQPGLGEMTRRNILNPNSGWDEIIEDMDDGNLEALKNIRRGSFWLEELNG